ncbi:MAG: DNA-binding protein [Cyanobacteria bacterium J069]|nr:MAG: DNA-binding protein [Cyanobacteria bacterium J069]
MDAIALRLIPQQDLKAELDALAVKHLLEAACIITCVGSLTRAVLRLAGQTEPTVFEGRFEIVSLVGVLAVHGSHYHMAIADATGRTIGGHVLAGCQIYTTAEIVVGVLPNVRFRRELDPATGYRELAIEER